MKEWQSLSKDEVLEICNLFYNKNQSNLAEKNWDLTLNQPVQELHQIIKGQIIQIESVYQKVQGNLLNIINENQAKITSNDQIMNSNISNKINFQLLEDCSIQQNEFCLAVAFNKDSTIMIAGAGNSIKVFEFKFGKVQLKNQLSGHTKLVQSLYFLQTSVQFISGGKDSQMLHWSMNKENTWVHQQIFRNGHAGEIFCIIMNEKEDLLISCSDDKSIKFWKWINNEWACTQTLECHTNTVYSLSLNEQGDQLISCSEDKTVKISKQREDKRWSVVQIIELYANRLCFIKNNLISIQLENGERMFIYELKKNIQEFIKIKEIQVEKGDRCFSYFPQTYNKQKQIIQSKNGNRVNFFTLKNDSDFELEQSIIFSSPSIYGTMSNDGQYLVTWGSSQRYLQIRKNLQA